MIDRNNLIDRYRHYFNQSPNALALAPGRVNLIGEHTDYNDGFVCPMAIDREVAFALAPRADNVVCVESLDLQDRKGVAWALRADGFELSGFDAVMSGDVLRGAGLSSSAALEMATIEAFKSVSGFECAADRMALLGRKAENGWVGVNCGIMDQMISAAGREGYAMLLDCRSLKYTLYPVPEGTSVVVLDTSTRRGLEGSAYNERREQCEVGARAFGVEKLRDLTVVQFEAGADRLVDVVRRRCRHVVSENERTTAAAEAMKAGDAAQLGELMNASHESLRDDFEVSCESLDALVEAARDSPGCLGARMTGAGFGGCAVALVESEKAGEFVETVARDYEQRTGLKPSLSICKPSAGARHEEI